jgi:glycerophosphoryl diester phosphodiesterase
MVLISAHRCGASGRPELENSRAGLERALGFDIEYVEFDVQRSADGRLFLRHDSTVPVDGRRVGIETLTYAEVCAAAGEPLAFEAALRLLAGHKGAHIDFKFSSPPELYATPEGTWEVHAAQLARSVLGDEGLIITSLEDRSVRAIRDWCDAEGWSLPVGLSLGRGLAETPWLERPGVRLEELAPTRRFADSHANLVVAHRNLARLRVARWAARHELPLLVWTVDEPRRLRAWLSSPRVWLVTTNHPERACRIRDELRA